MAFARNITADIRAEAAAWLARLRADDKSASDETAFRTWLAKDMRHAAAFEAVTDVWDVAGAAWTEPVAKTSRQVRRIHRRALLTGIGALAAAGLCLTVWQRANAGVYETAVGKQKHAVLPDGTQVFLDTDTRIRASFDSRTRNVALERGRCNFQVTDSDERPFVVNAAALQVVAGLSTFDVSREGDEVCVVLQQGSATVAAPDGSGKETLRSGERLIAGTGSKHIDRPNLLPLLAWQTGQAVFDNESLAEAVREMNRYSLVKIAIQDADIAKMRISGVYRVGDNVAFAHSVATLLPVVLVIDTNQVSLERDPARGKRT